jgi:hypothetical protein
MSVLTGLAPVGTYGSQTESNFDELLRIIPDPDAPHGTGAVAGGAHLDEMSPGAAAQLRVELLAALAAGGVSGTYTVTEADNTANQINITTGLADFTLTKSAVSIYRSGSEVLTARTLSKQSGGVLRIADSTYQATAGDIVNWAVRL